MNIAICDDVEMERGILRYMLEELLSQRDEDIHIIEYGSGEAVLADFTVEEVRFSLIFLDIYMSGITGVETARRLRASGCKSHLVFLTTSPDFAIEGYEVDAAGYLLKPVREEMLQNLFDRILLPVHRQQVGLKCGREYRYIYLDEVLWAESKNHTVYIHLLDGTVIDLRGKLDEIQTLLDSDSMLRCHQSYLVNMVYVTNVDENGFQMQDGSHVPIRVRSRHQITDAYHQWFLSRY
jgi:DNA-binding LytR/AlgR family response regulator